jgi:transcriptional regulator
MYRPKYFEETRIDVMHGLMRDFPLASLVINTSRGLSANHIPMLLIEGGSAFGKLQCHVARKNPIWQEYLPKSEALAIFQGSQAYITPSWYETKKETGKVVPTWDYASVNAYGIIQIIEDAEWLRSQIERLTTFHEANNPEQWKVSDAPEEFIDKMIAGIIGIEFEITRLEGKWKVSQNQPERNIDSVIAGLQKRNGPQDAMLAEIIMRGAS